MENSFINSRIIVFRADDKFVLDGTIVDQVDNAVKIKYTLFSFVGVRICRWKWFTLTDAKHNFHYH